MRRIFAVLAVPAVLAFLPLMLRLAARPSVTQMPLWPPVVVAVTVSVAVTLCVPSCSQ